MKTNDEVDYFGQSSGWGLKLKGGENGKTEEEAKGK